MSLAVLLAVVVLSSPHQAAAPAAPDLHNLRWVRGVVTASTPDTLTLKLQDRALTITLDSATEIVGVAPAPGSLIETHYSDHHGVRRAVVVLTGTGPGDLSKKPRSSLRGTVTRLKRSTLTVRSGRKTRALSIDKHSRLVDAGGRALGAGRAEIDKLLAPDADVLVKYEEDGDIIAGDLTIYGGNDKVVEIRQLKHEREP